MKVTCRECGKSWEALEAVLFGRKISPPNLCDSCLDADLEASRLQRQRDAFTDRVRRAEIPTDRQHVPIPPGPVSHLAEQWAAGDIPVLVLTGPVGVGKTYLASAACWKALERRSVRWVEVARAMGQLRASFGDDDRARALKAFNGHDSIVLDDLDKLPATEAGLSMIFAAVDSRISSGAPLLVTMNCSVSRLAAKIDRKALGIGTAIASRLAGGEVANLTGRDRRQAA